LKQFLYISLIFSILAFSSCSGTKGLQPDDSLFVGTAIKYTNKENIVKKRNFNEGVKLNQITPNDPGILNVKTGLYNIFKTSGKKGFKHIVKNKLGSKPVVFEPSMVTITENRIRKYAVEDGYLQAEVSCDSTFHKKRKVKIACMVETGPRYMIDSVFYIQDSLPISGTLDPMYDIKYTKRGDYYQLKNLKADREHFVTTANENGFPYVEQQDIIFFVDTTHEANLVDVHMRLRPSDDISKYERYRVGKIYVNPNYSIETDIPTDKSEMVKMEDFYIKSGYDFLRESALQKAIYLEEGRIFNQRRNRITSDRLLDFGLFKFVNIKTITNADNTIDHFINLTTYPLENISGEFEVNNRAGNYLGIAGQASYTNRNIFRGAEKFDLTLSGGLETQFGDEQPLINTSDIKLEARITMPNIVLPFRSFRTNRNFIPKTFTSLSINQQNRIELYQVRALKGKYGFRWNETKHKESFFTPIDLSWVVLSNTSPDFENFLTQNPRQAESFRTTLLFGSSYEYLYNKRDDYNPINQSYFRGTIESAGNALSLFSRSSDPANPAKVFGTPYSQYLRITADFRKYFALDAGSIATRLFSGVGFAYGNSNLLPYSKQFSIGGANSLRAFNLRTLGPGEFQSLGGIDGQFLDQTGDIKLEANIEYRFPIIPYFKGAAFLDAGNVWLRESDNPKSVFGLSSFLDQIAVGTGLGLRLDAEFIILRLDIAFPIRTLKNDGQFGWVIEDIDFAEKQWRDDNIVYNIGIGYPF